MSFHIHIRKSILTGVTCIYLSVLNVKIGPKEAKMKNLVFLVFMASSKSVKYLLTRSGAFQNHISCGNDTFRSEITLVRVKITLFVYELRLCIYAHTPWIRVWKKSAFAKLCLLIALIVLFGRI
jgi:hypothetical protein